MVKKILIAILSLIVVCIPLSLQSTNVKASETYYYHSENIHNKSTIMTGTTTIGKKVVVTFPKGHKSEATVNDEGSYSINIPQAEKPLIAKERIKVEFLVSNKIVKTEYAIIKRNLASAIITKFNKDEVSGTAEPGRKVTIGSDFLTEYPSGVSSIVQSDKNGKWNFKFKKPLINKVAVFVRCDNYNYANETISGVAEYVASMPGEVNPVNIKSTKITGRAAYYLLSANNALEIKITFPNGTIVSKKIENKDNIWSWSIDVPKTIALKPNDKIKVETMRTSLDGSLGFYPIEPTIVIVGGTTSNTPSVNYQAHVQNIGWQSYVKDGQVAGTFGRGLRVESFRMNLSNLPVSGGIQYATHIQNIGWQAPKTSNGISGTTGQGLRMEAMRINLTGDIAKQYDIYYRTHVENFGWLGWAKNGENAGTEGRGLRMEAIEVRLVKKGGSAPQPGNAFLTKPTPVPTPKEYYKNCTEMKKVHPKGAVKGVDSWYDPKLDGDNDGLACER